jgi:hypothetical protein
MKLRMGILTTRTQAGRLAGLHQGYQSSVSMHTHFSSDHGTGVRDYT